MLQGGGFGSLNTNSAPAFGSPAGSAFGAVRQLSCSLMHWVCHAGAFATRACCIALHSIAQSKWTSGMQQLVSRPALLCCLGAETCYIHPVACTWCVLKTSMKVLSSCNQHHTRFCGSFNTNLDVCFACSPQRRHLVGSKQHHLSALLSASSSHLAVCLVRATLIALAVFDCIV